jgi:hypothetical protein
VHVQPPVPAPPPVQPQGARQGTRANPAPPVAKISFDEIVKARLTQKSSALAGTRPYRDLPVINAKENVGSWWKTHEKIYPAHAALARRYLAIPASSAPCERLFSTGGRVIEKRRANLTEKSARAIILVHENIERLQDVVFDEYLY